MMRIGKVVETLAISADTLRYYEKIRLMPRVHRSDGGVRFYNDKDLARLRFIKRAQRTGFSLEEIAALLSFRDSPQPAKPQVRKLAQRKLEEIELHLVELRALCDELRSLTSRCRGDAKGCPILDGFEKT